MKQLTWLLLLIGFALNLNAQKAHSKTHKKRPPVYKGSLGLSFNQGLWFPAKQEYHYTPFTFLSPSAKYQYGASINADFKIYKSIYTFVDLGMDRTTFSTNKVIWDTIEFVIDGNPYRPRFVSYETPNWMRQSILRYYGIGGIAYKLPIKKHSLIVGIGMYTRNGMNFRKSKELKI